MLLTWTTQGVQGKYIVDVKHLLERNVTDISPDAKLKGTRPVRSPHDGLRYRTGPSSTFYPNHIGHCLGYQGSIVPMLDDFCTKDRFGTGHPRGLAARQRGRSKTIAFQPCAKHYIDQTVTTRADGANDISLGGNLCAGTRC